MFTMIKGLNSQLAPGGGCDSDESDRKNSLIGQLVLACQDLARACQDWVRA